VKDFLYLKKKLHYKSYIARPDVKANLTHRIGRKKEAWFETYIHTGPLLKFRPESCPGCLLHITALLQIEQ
jgi:hypothetical protein